MADDYNYDEHICLSREERNLRIGMCRHGMWPHEHCQQCAEVKGSTGGRGGVMSIQKTCCVCGRKSKKAKTAKWLLGLDGPVCFACFLVWWDGNTTDADKIKEESMLLDSDTGKPIESGEEA